MRAEREREGGGVEERGERGKGSERKRDREVTRGMTEQEGEGGEVERQPLQALPCLMLAGTATSNERWGAEEKGHRGVRETNGGMKYWPRQNRRKETDREREEVMLWKSCIYIVMLVNHLRISIYETQRRLRWNILDTR